MHARQTTRGVATPMWVEPVGTATASSWASEDVGAGCLTPPPPPRAGMRKAVAAVVPDWDAHVVPYVAEMVETMRRLEARHYDSLPADEELWVQPSLTPVHRALLVDLMVGTGHALDVSLDALALTVSCIDRYLARIVVPDEPALELLGLAALLVATYSRHRNCTTSRAAAQHLYPPEEILAMECALVPALHFQLHVPTLATFLPHAALSAATTMDPHDADMASRVAVVVRHLALVALADVRLATGFTPSLVAAAVVAVAMELAVGGEAVPWEVVAEAMGYEVDKVKEVARVVHSAAGTPHARIDAMLCRALRALGIEEEEMEELEEGEVDEDLDDTRLAVEAARVVASELAF
ncbi:hypothetical protein AMAG_05721 [Allomyces macrogynus ATCC 38327]|uniref:Cyclin N-terminal domain-containing protein n=1 Tax=Allomyces macrogynus (strain ATCC 38327) TaxID=578462 RepID=A0A0L0SD20_ALLM3|nr:hypothetical protein AMAG_05721 [Allomyces macrogynus ATCC 38327]|eukprot:KNE60324.1 hypothetical protein AMAG_05721 [Allomyces macrogynus ATCC 38327]